MAKIFVSLPMHGLKDEYVRERREKIFDIFKNDGDELLDTIEPKLDISDIKEPRLVYLGRAIRVLANADVVIFAPDWKSAKGCHVEYTICELYNIPYIKMSEEWNV